MVITYMYRKHYLLTPTSYITESKIMKKKKKNEMAFNEKRAEYIKTRLSRRVIFLITLAQLFCRKSSLSF